MTSGDIEAKQLIQEACDLVDRVEPRLCALVAEPKRRRRLLAEAERQDPTLRPFLVGVKDIVNVAGLPTRAGSTLPTELFAGPRGDSGGPASGRGRHRPGQNHYDRVRLHRTTPHHQPKRRAPHTGRLEQRLSCGSGGRVCAVGDRHTDSRLDRDPRCLLRRGRFLSRRTAGFQLTVWCRSRRPWTTSGFLARDVETIAFAAEIVCDGWHATSQSALPAIGLTAPSHLDPVDASARATFDLNIAALSAAGCRVLHTTSLTDTAAIARRHRRLIAAQFATVHHEWFGEYGDRYRPKSVSLVTEGAALRHKVIDEGVKGSSRLRAGLERTMDNLGIDIWMSPAATGPAPRGLDTIGDPIMAVPWTHAHMPVVCLPAGTAPSGLPVGIQLIGRLGADEQLLGFARAVARSMA